MVVPSLILGMVVVPACRSLVVPHCGRIGGQSRGQVELMLLSAQPRMSAESRPRADIHKHIYWAMEVLCVM